MFQSSCRALGSSRESCVRPLEFVADDVDLCLMAGGCGSVSSDSRAGLRSPSLNSPPSRHDHHCGICVQLRTGNKFNNLEPRSNISIKLFVSE